MSKFILISFNKKKLLKDNIHWKLLNVFTDCVIIFFDLIKLGYEPLASKVQSIDATIERTPASSKKPLI